MSIAGEHFNGLLRPPRAGTIRLRLAERRPELLDRVEDLPRKVDLLGGGEQRRVAQQHVEDQAFVCLRGGFGERATVAEVHRHVAHLHRRAARHLRAEAHGHALVGLHADHDGVLAELLGGGRFERQMRGAFEHHGDLRDALEKLQLNDASLYYEPETSVALGFGFRCGFLGLLHLEIIQERLEREYNLDLVTTAPSVIYKVYKTNGEMIELTNPTNLPDPSEIEYMEEPMVKAEIMVTTEFIGAIMDLCQERRGQYEGMEYMEETRALLKYRLPLNEIIYDFFDALKSRSRGYASLDYELDGYERSELVKLDILVNKEEVDALSFIVHADTAYERGRKMCEKLKDEIPRQLFEIPIQAAIGSKVIARETVRAMRKDVLAKCYGGDISRKKKLLEKQKEGKKRMRQVGNVEIPQKAFMSVLKLDDK